MNYCKSGEHPLLRHDSNCEKCELGKNRVRHNEAHISEKNFIPQVSVGSGGPDKLEDVKLIVLSDVIGHYESISNEPMHDISSDRPARKKGLLQSLNAGAFMRMTLELMFNLDTYHEVIFTNAIKCSPNQLKPLETHIRSCTSQWLNSELYIFDEHIPEVPLLIAGTMAFKGICHAYKEKASLLSSIGFNNCRRRKDLKINDRPIVVTNNPVSPARSMPKIETAVKTVKGKTVITYNEWLFPQLPGSPVDRFIKDLYPLTPYLKK